MNPPAFNRRQFVKIAGEGADYHRSIKLATLGGLSAQDSFRDG